MNVYIAFLPLLTASEIQIANWEGTCAIGNSKRYIIKQIPANAAFCFAFQDNSMIHCSPRLFDMISIAKTFATSACLLAVICWISRFPQQMQL